MKKRTILPLFISSILGGIIFVLSITTFFINKELDYYPIFMLILSSGLIIISGVLSYFINDRIFGLINLAGTILGFIGIRNFYTLKIADYLIPFWMVLIILLTLIFNFSSIILSIYRLKVNQTEFNNSLFGTYLNKTKTSISLILISIIVLLIIMISLIMIEWPMPITIIVCSISIVLYVLGKILVIFKNNKIGSLIIISGLIILIMGANPQEFSYDNTCIILMLAEYVLGIIITICEFVKPLDSEETKFSPKEYKK